VERRWPDERGLLSFSSADGCVILIEVVKGAMANPPQTLVIVDDDPLVRKTLGRALTRLGYEVLTASTADEAIAIAEIAPPNLAIFDLGLDPKDSKDRSGFKVVGALSLACHARPRSGRPRFDGHGCARGSSGRLCPFCGRTVGLER